jgi:putative oxidoreductase
MILGKVFSPLKAGGPLLVRLAVGVVFLYLGADHLGIVGPDGFRTSIRSAIGIAEHAGFHPAELFGYVLALSQLLGGFLLIVGFATRYAAAIFVFLCLFAILKLYPARTLDTVSTEFAFSVVLGLACASLLLTGAGPLAVDRIFGGD